MCGGITWVTGLAGGGGAPETAPAVLAAGAGSFALEFLRVSGVLLGLLGLLILGLHLCRRFWLTPASATPLIRILGTHYLAARQALWVVAVGRERFLLASSPDRVELLTPLAPGGEEGAGAGPSGGEAP